MGPSWFVFATSVWKTQTIIYRHKHADSKRIELQMRDVGALGYKRRRVEVTQLTPFLTLVHQVNNDVDNDVQWVRSDEYINELGLKDLLYNH
jgi:hypothetical protein